MLDRFQRCDIALLNVYNPHRLSKLVCITKPNSMGRKGRVPPGWVCVGQDLTRGGGRFLELLFPIVAMQTKTACSVLQGRYPRGEERQVGMTNLKVLLTP